MRNSRCEEQKYPRKDTDPSTPHLINNPRVKKKKGNSFMTILIKRKA